MQVKGPHPHPHRTNKQKDREYHEVAKCGCVETSGGPACTLAGMSAAHPVVTYSSAEEGWERRKDPTLHTRLQMDLATNGCTQSLHTEHLTQT